MARLFPFRSDASSQEGEPRIVDLEGEDADAVFSALSSTTARRIYARLDEEPGTPSDVAKAVDSSIQNVRYHLENLEEAGLVAVVDTWYSSRGNEMSVYGTTDGPLIVTSDESTADRLRAALSRLVGGIGALAGGSLLVQYAFARWIGRTGSESPPAGGSETTGTDDGGSTDADGADADDDASIQGEDGTTDGPGAENADGPDADPGSPDGYSGDGADAGDPGEFAADAPETTDAILSSAPPGLLFFLGGLVVLLAVIAYWYWYRPRYAY